jgi:class 3 adenylate cyclase
MSNRYFGQFFNEADSLSTKPEFREATKVAHDSGAFTTQDMLTEATRLAQPGSALARLGQQIGHPRYKELPFGQSEKANAVVLFLDVRGFTRLSIELENDELIRILQKLSIACVATVYQHGGYIGDFTGDGIMAFFDKDEAALASLQAATDLLMGVRDFVNPALKRDGDTGINVAVGIEYGEVVWTRIGLSRISQVKPVSEVTYVAGKLATRDHTSKWDCCIGEQLASVIPDGLAKRVEGISYKQESTSGTALTSDSQSILKEFAGHCGGANWLHESGLLALLPLLYLQRRQSFNLNVFPVRQTPLCRQRTGKWARWSNHGGSVFPVGFVLNSKVSVSLK